MNELTWQFDGLPFRMLLELVGRDRLPFPLQYRPIADSAADYHRQRHEASNKAQRALDDDLRLAVDIVLRPLVRIEVVGHTRTQNAGAVKLRAHAAVGHGFAAVLTQAPGADELSGGRVTLRLTAASAAVNAVLSVLPSAQRGSTARIDVERPSDAAPASPLMARVEPQTNIQRYEKLFARSPSGAGEILVCAGSAADSRPQEGTTGVQWVEFRGDGRYMVRHSSMISVLPVSAEELAAEIRRCVDESIAY
ncbi:MAG: ESX secretion-associated protein EspG [Rhodococcus sp. (in: high G+C Gram-positive bacteria)]